MNLQPGTRVQFHGGGPATWIGTVVSSSPAGTLCVRDTTRPCWPLTWADFQPLTWLQPYHHNRLRVLPHA